jgi:hypothetical protein
MKPVQKIAGYLTVSRELMAQIEEDQQAHQQWLDASDEQREQWRHEAVEQRAAERASAERVLFTLTALLKRLGWTHEYALHILQPYCECYDGSDGWAYCQHAHDLGLVP